MMKINFISEIILWLELLNSCIGFHADIRNWYFDSVITSVNRRITFQAYTLLSFQLFSCIQLMFFYDCL